ncbi:chitinase, putative [Phytophthora infestans T30-4]|uniref:Chitinase, putative n=1 Tax=Phytophthora infestans (strain T30-4) TaxID=403677 RepID=D0NXB7_PHYIT|nr:chitinase, putative [Phytophthora infestans T30-4]EEY67714.1 chitinase, putative [Phytophthora infestans T30-4]|eukprot:XP_002896267.1 chitinase, putative [Phytophthora infestans T30-4]
MLLAMVSASNCPSDTAPSPTPQLTPEATSTTTEAPSPTPQLTPEATPTTTEVPSSSSSSGEGSSSFARFFDQDRFHEVFPNAVELYSFNGLVDASIKYTEFVNSGNDDSDKRELAAFLAQTAHESDSFKATEEYGYEGFSVWEYCRNTTYPCAPGRRYHGRGPIQIRWNYNYYNAGEALGVDLPNSPDIVASDTTVTWMTALWYWMTPQNGRVIHDVVTDESGFAQSTDIINGGLECGPEAPNKANEEQRITYFTKMCEALGVEPLGATSCNA